jgi:DNA-binding response OmpR family regulator
MLPLKDGFSLAQDLRRYNQKIPIIFLTAKSQKEDRIKGFKLGGDDYITKPFSLEEFLLRVEAVLKRVYDRPTSADQNHQFFIGNSIFDFSNQTLLVQGKSCVLTNKEARLLRLLAQHKNQIVERDVIMKSIWENDGFFVARSMDVFISKLRKYLAGDTSIAIKNVHGVGYRLEENHLHS